jgi:uncharacterized protein YdcH (DUF465 family)
MGYISIWKESRRSKDIDKEIEHEIEEIKIVDEERILFIGLPGSGKTAIVEKFRETFPFIPISSWEYPKRKEFIRICLAKTFYFLIENAVKIVDRESALDDDIVQALKNCERVDQEMLEILRKASVDPTIDEVYRILKQSETMLSAQDLYLFKKSEDILKDDYSPDAMDIVKCPMENYINRNRYFNSAQVLIEGRRFTLFDLDYKHGIGKYLHLFGNASVLVFVVAADEYDEKSKKFNGKSKLAYAADVFAEICKTPGLNPSVICLILNKIDLFHIKFPVVPFSKSHDDFKGDNSDAAILYIYNLFQKAVPDHKISMYNMATFEKESFKFTMTNLTYRILEDRSESTTMVHLP